MVNLQTAEKALKTVYLNVVTEQLNKSVNPLMAKMEQTSSDVWGKEIAKLVSYGINGGIGAGTESGTLPTAAGNNYAQFKTELKNLYGSIEISDKAIRASENSAGAFVNLLNAEMEGLLSASKYNLSRMMFGDGTGVLCTLAAASSASNTLTCNSVKNLIEGLVVDIYKADNTLLAAGRRITKINRSTKAVTISGDSVNTGTAGAYFTVQGSKGNELTGLGAIFGNGNLYGLTRADNPWLNPYIKNSCGALSTGTIQTAIDAIEENSGSTADMILCSYDVRRFYLDCLELNRSNVDYMNVDGGFKAISYNGIPVIADRFVEDGTMYILNSKDFTLHQLCDWRWLEGEGGNVIKQKESQAAYTATLVKYADIICSRPCGQAKLSGITAPSAS